MSTKIINKFESEFKSHPFLLLIELKEYVEKASVDGYGNACVGYKVAGAGFTNGK